GRGFFISYRIHVKGESTFTNRSFLSFTGSPRPAFNSHFYPAPSPWTRLLYLVHPAVRRRQYRQSRRCLGAPLDLAISHQQLAISASSNCHSDEHVLALEGFHHLHAFHRQLAFSALGAADREYRHARAE